jgi:glycosyltransferase involved in cell wall biosynthesis
MKKKILMCAESHLINSGFGRYTKEILSRLHEHPNYEVAEFGSYIDNEYKRDVPWKVYPNAVKDNHPESANYKSNPINQFGQWRFDKVVLHYKPDIVFDIRDYWMFSYQEMSPLLDYFHWVISPTIDSLPQKTEWLMTFENADIVMTHTDWAMKYLQSLDRPINTGFCISDSVDSSVFRPVSWTKKYHKISHNLDPDSIIIGSVMRNQKRKLISELFKSLRMLLDKTKNNKILLYLHTSYPEPTGWNIPELLQEHGVYNNVVFTYIDPINKKYYCSPYKGPKIPSPDHPNSYCVFPNVINGVSNEQLSSIYNLFDIYVQYAICEGLGIPQLEAASCGVPIFSTNYSGMEEIISKLDGQPISCYLTKELETGSDRAIPNNEDLVEKIIQWIALDTKQKKDISKNIRQKLIDNYSWEKTTKNIIKTFDNIEPKNKWHIPMKTFSNEVPAHLSNRDFIYFIIDNIICEPRLKRTYFIQNLVKSADESYSESNKEFNETKKQIVKSLEIYLNNKIYCEKIRSGEIDISKEEYLNV